MKFKVGDVVHWNGSLGEVTRVYSKTLFCDFTHEEDDTVFRATEWFFSDGRYRNSHREPSLNLATPEQVRFYQSKQTDLNSKVFR